MRAIKSKDNPIEIEIDITCFWNAKSLLDKKEVPYRLSRKIPNTFIFDDKTTKDKAFDIFNKAELIIY